MANQTLSAQQIKLYKELLWALFLMNIFDGLLTIMWIETGKAQEANPLLAPLYAIDPILFMVTKSILVGLSCLFLYRVIQVKMARFAAHLSCSAYLAVLLYHLSGLLI